MFWDRVEPHITPRLESAVERAYRVFDHYRLSGTIIHCDCPVCMTEETARKLSVLPLKEIDAPTLAEYTNSAHGKGPGQIEYEFKHFLPRYFDLIAQCQPPSHLDLDLCLDRLHGYRDRWPEDEIDAVDGFFNAFVEASLHQTKLVKWPVGFRLEFDMGQVLTMIVTAGGDLDGALEVFDQGPDPETAIHMASMRLDVGLRDQDYVYENSFLKDYGARSRQIGDWLLRDVVSERIVASTERIENRGYFDILDQVV